MSSLRITEIFLSLQGETSSTGVLTVFIRLTGCPLRCSYCDTTYAFKGGQWWSLGDILSTVAAYGAHYVTVTGGEPLAQPDCLPLLAALCDAGYRVSLETSGALPVHEVDPRVVKIVDIKTPGSSEVERNHWANLEALNSHDEIKFVIADREDYLWAKACCEQHQLASRVQEVLFSASVPKLPDKQLADWIIADRLAVRLQVQLHKVLWGDSPGK